MYLLFGGALAVECPLHVTLVLLDALLKLN